jgi:hypothetical protein
MKAQSTLTSLRDKGAKHKTNYSSTGSARSALNERSLGGGVLLLETDLERLFGRSSRASPFLSVLLSRSLLERLRGGDLERRGERDPERRGERSRE